APPDLGPCRALLRGGSPRAGHAARAAVPRLVVGRRARRGHRCRRRCRRGAHAGPPGQALAQHPGRLPDVPLRRLPAPRSRRLVLRHDRAGAAADPVAGAHRHPARAVDRRRAGPGHVRRAGPADRTADLQPRRLAPGRGVGRGRAGDRPGHPAHRLRPRTGDRAHPPRQRAGREALRGRAPRGGPAGPRGQDRPGQHGDGRDGRHGARGDARARLRGVRVPRGGDAPDPPRTRARQPRRGAPDRVQPPRLRRQRRQRGAQQHRRQRPVDGRHRHGQRGRHLRPPQLPRPPRPPRRPRRAHGAGQPQALRPRAAAPPRALPPLRPGGCPAPARPRQLQAGQRHAGPPPRRPAADHGVRPAAPRDPQHRHRRPARRRRVRHPAHRRRRGGGPSGRRPRRRPGPRPRRHARRRTPPGHGQRRRRDVQGRRRALRRRPGAGGHDDVRRQGGRPQPGGGPARGRRPRPAQLRATALAEPHRGGAGDRPLRAAPPADHGPQRRPHRCGRGAPAAAGAGRARAAGPLHLHRRAHRPDAAGGRLGDRPQRRDAGPDPPARPGLPARGQPVGPLHRPPGDRVHDRRVPPAPRRPPELAHPRDHRDGCGGRRRPGARLRRADDRPGLPVRPRRLRGRVRLVLLPQAPAVRLREDRRRVRGPLQPLGDRPDDHAVDRGHRPRPRQADRGGVRLRPRGARGGPGGGCRPGPGLPHRPPGALRRVRGGVPPARTRRRVRHRRL
ncbi:MAG: diguanylate cyclase/phosphodiesterase (GGDEF & EAL domains) with PAS/PAC sensor(s), partial [uncultured Nocardioides sp.]